MSLRENAIYCGDCFHILQKFPEESVDLIYVDPPFFTQEFYEDPFGNGTAIKAFQDKWYSKDGKRGDIFCYLEYMEPRLEQMYRILKPTGTFYLHCDYHANAHLRILLDRLFKRKNFRNEIIWFYPDSPGRPRRDFPRKHDTIFRYTKTNQYVFNDLDIRVAILQASKERYKSFRVLGGKKYPGGEHAESATIGKIPEDVWRMPVVKGNSKESQGYPTQKPEILLERIIKASSNPLDLVLDPMCGCGTAIAVAYRLGRRFIGVDCSPNACKLMAQRLRSLDCKISEADIVNLPVSLTELKKMDPFAFQKWAIDQLYGQMSPSKSADMGIDGYDFYGTPVQVKQSYRVGRNVIDNFETAIRRKSKKKGIIIAFSFVQSSRNEVARAKRKDGLDIELLAVKELLTRQDT